jgi:predicted SAM-dependent methyltransferase
VRIVVGASGVYSEAWIPTDIEYLNLLRRADWIRFMRPASVDRMLAEHVWEHLSEENGRTAAAMCFEFLKPGGVIRIAVPDGNNPDVAFIEYARPGGTGAGADDHKILYRIDSLSAVFQSAGFETIPLEYFDAAGVFHTTDWNSNDGMITRSLRFDKRNSDGKSHFTSVIIDAVKPV